MCEGQESETVYMSSPFLSREKEKERQYDQRRLENESLYSVLLKVE